MLHAVLENLERLCHTRLSHSEDKDPRGRQKRSFAWTRRHSPAASMCLAGHAFSKHKSCLCQCAHLQVTGDYMHYPSGNDIIFGHVFVAMANGVVRISSRHLQTNRAGLITAPPQ